jgi:hypothetical protein
VTTRTLRRFSKRHLAYEVRMLQQTARVLRHTTGWLADAALESWIVHLRVLITFLYDGRRFPDDIIAEDFIEHPERWPRLRGRKPSMFKSAQTRANKQIAHLSRKRYWGRAPQKQWHVSTLMARLNKVLQKFAEHGSRQRLHPDVLRLVLPNYGGPGK